jgi:hypothetical protein
MKHLALFTTALVLGCFSASATTITYIGADLSGLSYYGNPAGDATFVNGTPDYAHLYTDNANVGGDTPKVVVNGPLGKLNDFSANYVILSQTGGGPGNSGYWDLILSDPANLANTLELIAFSGLTFDGNTQVHSPSNLFSFGALLSSVYGISNGSTTLGNWIVNSAGVEIGAYQPGVSPMDLKIASITINGSLPDGTSTLPLLSAGLGGLFLFGYARNRQVLVK